MKDEMYFEDFRVGDKFKIPSRTMTDAHFLFFAGMTGDNHPLHYDQEYCKQTRFGRPVAHGLMVAGMAAVGASNLSPAIKDSIVAFLEQSSRFLKPVFVGDTLSVALEVVAVEPHRTTGVVKLKTAITNQRGELVMEGSHTYLFKRRG